MTATTGSEWDEIVTTWGHAYTLVHDPDAPPDERYTARPLRADTTLRAATPAALLDAIKDDAAARAFAAKATP
ncbi:MAG TPA: hypothetical protein VHZ03_41675 [Trebonia sp.]|jgi:hypothetical protein|nr:hypothetical protein [Trebonia sp.]